MASWNLSMLGEYAESIRLGLEGRNRAEPQAAGIVDHCLNWAGMSLFHLGEWDRQLEIFREVEGLMGERTAEPPYFMMGLFGATAFVKDARGLPGAGPLLDLLERTLGNLIEGSVMASHWLAWAAARRGEIDRASGFLRETPVDSATVRPFQDQVMAELLALSERWSEAPAFVEDSRAYALEAELLALPVHLDRLEGRTAIATDRLGPGLEALERARGGFARLGATWERARTELDLAEALESAGRSEEARRAVKAAAGDLERIGARIEAERLRSIRERLA